MYKRSLLGAWFEPMTYPPVGIPDRMTTQQPLGEASLTSVELCGRPLR
ncbi:hypothetical protein SGPA1_31340 [Streptomyces misionensis JCM 4497]